MEKIKEYVPRESKKNSENHGNKTFELYEITMQCDKLKVFKEEYIKTFNGPLFNRIISSNPKWFESNVLFDADTYGKRNFFEFGIAPLKKVNNAFINGFINSSLHSTQVKAVRFEGKDYYIYTNSDINKKGRTYTVSPTILINEDIYNIAKIQSRDFSGLTISDLTKYRDFFKLSNEPYLIVTESWLEDLYRNGHISKEEYKNRITRYENEVNLVKTLR